MGYEFIVTSPLRIEYEGFYHVTARGNEWKIFIF